MRTKLGVLALFCVVACGGGSSDERVAMVGSYSIQGTITASGAGGTITQSTTISGQLKDGTGPTDLSFVTSSCTYPATATSSTTFTISSVSCPAYTLSNGCSEVDSVASGSGTVAAGKLNFTLSGQGTVSCSSGQSSTISIQETGTGTKQ